MREIYEGDAMVKKLLPMQKPDPDALYVPSQYAVSCEVSGRHYVYHTLTKQLLETSLPQTAHTGGDYDFLIEKYFLVPEGKDECRLYENVSSLLRIYTARKRHKTYVILPTLGCNARCIYCYEEGVHQVSMTVQIAEQTIQYILDTCGEKKIHLTWFGGEPLLRPEIIDRICSGIKQAGIEYSSSMISNGSLITDEIIGKMTGLWNLHEIQLSMDGAEKDYIDRKQYRQYNDFYHTVLDAANRMAEHGIRISIRCNIDENNCDGIASFIHDYASLIRDKERVRLYFALLNHVRMGENDLTMWRKISTFDQLLNAEGIPSRMGTDLKHLRISHCMADQDASVIAPDGSLYLCEHCPDEARIGDIFSGVTDEDAHREFSRMDRTRPKCRKCPYLPVCTSFAACPVEDTHCVDVWALQIRNALNRFLSENEEAKTERSEEMFC